jgi:hypothetical protein
MAIVKQLQNYGKKHPYVSLALAGTFGYYFYESFVKPRMETKGPSMYQNPAGLGMTTSTSTTTSSSHIPDMRGEDTGEPSMNIPYGSGMFGLGTVIKTAKPVEQTDAFISQQNVRTLSGARNNPQSFLKYDQTQQLAGFSPSARRRVGHASGSSNLGYSPQLDTQFENREAMLTGDLRKHEDILGFSGLMPLAGGDWYE